MSGRKAPINLRSDLVGIGVHSAKTETRALRVETPGPPGFAPRCGYLHQFAVFAAAFLGSDLCEPRIDANGREGDGSLLRMDSDVKERIPHFT